MKDSKGIFTKIILGGVIALVIFLLYKIMKGFNVVGGAVGTELDNFGVTASEKSAKLKTLEAFRPSYYHTVGATKLKKYADIKAIAGKIHEARTLEFYTNDSQILGAFKLLSNQAQISQLAECFENAYNEDLLNYFYSPMQDRYLQQLYDLVVSLPKK